MPEAPKTRAEIAREDTWKLEDLFLTDEVWENAFTAAQAAIAAFPALSGTLGKSAESMLAGLKKSGEIDLMLERLYVYAHMKRDEDNGAAKYQGMTDRAMMLMAQYGEAAAFFTPELLSIPREIFLAWAEEPQLQTYRHGLLTLDRKRAHVLSEPEERIMALAVEPLSGFDTIFTMLDSVDQRFGTVTDEKGETQELTHGSFHTYLENRDRRVRKDAFTTYYAAYEKLTNTYGAAYASSVKGDVFSAKARHFESSVAQALSGSNVPLSVYTGLIDAVHEKLPALGEYLKLRKRLLGVDELHMYDLYVPMVKHVETPMEYPAACALVKEALLPLGQDYVALLERAFSERWIDVYENRGKTTGAFSWGAYGTHPYVLLNYQPEGEYAFTIAHELGHALHSYFSDEAQAYENAQYKIMAAEVASTVNEVLLLRHMLGKEADPSRRAYLLNHFLEQFRTTVFRQTMFAEFEYKAHEMAEVGEPLTVESLSALYHGLNETYYQEAVVDPQIYIEWMRIPHFYNAFYVYQYATGFSAAVAIAKNILEGGDVLPYREFLRSGGSDDPIVLLQRAGVDLTQKQSILSALELFESSLKELSALV